MKLKNKFKSMSVISSLGVSVAAAIAIVLISCMMIAAFVLNGGIQEDRVKFLTKAILVVAVFSGLKINIALQIKDKYVVAGLYSGVLILLTFISGIIFNIRIVNIMMNMLFVLCGIILGLLLFNREPKKHSHVKKRYR